MKKIKEGEIFKISAMDGEERQCNIIKNSSGNFVLRIKCKLKTSGFVYEHLNYGNCESFRIYEEDKNWNYWL